MLDIRDQSLRDHVGSLLGGHGAHAPIEKILADVPVAVRGTRPRRLSHSPWEVLEHLRIAQWDILEYVRNPAYVSPEWPQGYWPAAAEPPDARAWARSHAAFAADLAAILAIVSDPSVDLLAPIPHAQDGHTVLRQALLVADHNAYHGAEMVTVRRLLSAW
jgi:hypothetical protein